MNTLKTNTLILVMCLAVAGCSPLRSHTLRGKPPVEEDIMHGSGDSLLAESLEEAKPLVDLILEE